MGKKRENFQNVGFSHKFAYDNKGKIDKIKNRQTGLEKKRTIITLYLKLHHIMCQLNLKKVGGKKEKTKELLYINRHYKIDIIKINRHYYMK